MCCCWFVRWYCFFLVSTLAIQTCTHTIEWYKFIDSLTFTYVLCVPQIAIAMMSFVWVCAFWFRSRPFKNNLQRCSGFYIHQFDQSKASSKYAAYACSKWCDGSACITQFMVSICARIITCNAACIEMHPLRTRENTRFDCPFRKNHTRMNVKLPETIWKNDSDRMANFLWTSYAFSGERTDNSKKKSHQHFIVSCDPYTLAKEYIITQSEFAKYNNNKNKRFHTYSQIANAKP